MRRLRSELQKGFVQLASRAPDQPFLMPVVIDATRQNDTRIPDRFRELQWTRLPGGETPSAFVERIRRLLVPQATPASAAKTSESPGPNTVQTARRLDAGPWQSRPWLWAISGVLAVALSYFVVDKFWLSKRTTAATTSAVLPSATAAEKSIAVLPLCRLTIQRFFRSTLSTTPP